MTALDNRVSPPPSLSGSLGTPRDYARYREMMHEARSLQGVSLWQDAWRRLRRNRYAMIALAYILAICLIAIVTPALPLQSPMQQHVGTRQYHPPEIAPARLEMEGVDKQPRTLTEMVAEHAAALREISPSDDAYAVRLAAHPYQKFWNQPDAITQRLIDLRLALFGNWCIPSICGTDALGRDVLARLLWGARISLVVALTGAFVSLVIGVSYGATSGYLGGWVDALMMRFVDTLDSIPFLFVVIFITSILSEPTLKAWLENHGVNRLMIFFAVIGAFFWFTMARVVRGQVISLKNEQFVDAARVGGAGTARIIFRHLIPNTMGIVLAYLTLTIPSVMLFEATLSFLSLGVQPPDVSLGLLIEEGRQVITPIKTYVWLIVVPSVALATTLLCFNILGDGLRDALDPRLKNR